MTLEEAIEAERKAIALETEKYAAETDRKLADEAVRRIEGHENVLTVLSAVNEMGTDADSMVFGQAGLGSQLVCM